MAWFKVYNCLYIPTNRLHVKLWLENCVKLSNFWPRLQSPTMHKKQTKIMDHIKKNIMFFRFLKTRGGGVREGYRFSIRKEKCLTSVKYIVYLFSLIPDPSNHNTDKNRQIDINTCIIKYAIFLWFMHVVFKLENTQFYVNKCKNLVKQKSNICSGDAYWNIELKYRISSDLRGEKVLSNGPILLSLYSRKKKSPNSTVHLHFCNRGRLVQSKIKILDYIDIIYTVGDRY